MTRLSSYQRDGLTLDVTDTGPEDGDPVVLLHGFPERATSWRDVAPRLHRHGLRTYALDQRGASPGARPSGRRAYAVGEFAADVHALAERIGEEAGRPVHLVGHDWGAATAWTAVAQRPELFASLTAFSVPHPRGFQQSWLSSTQGLRSWYMLAFNVPRVPEWLARRGVIGRMLRRGGMTRAEVERFQREVVDDGALPGGLGWYRAMFIRAGGAGRAVRVPTTMVWSDGDAFIGRAAVDRCADLVRAPYELVVLTGVTHWIPTQAPEAAAEAIVERVASVGPGPGSD